MKVIKNDSVVNVDVVNTIALGSVVDPKVVLLEHNVADYFDVNVNELSNWKHDTEAKKMICFLLYKHCHYSIASIAKQYRIDRFYLKNCIKDYYVRCLADDEFKVLVDRLLVLECNACIAGVG